jgi:CheY-like chemotaxis protein
MLTVRLLIVEDDPVILLDLKRTFTQPPSGGLAQIYGECRFKVDTAATARTARELLSKAASRNQPYDVVLFDLGLPIDEDHLDQVDDADVGMAILKELREQADEKPAKVSASVIVVASAHYQRLEELLRLGMVSDFVGKTWDPLNEIPYRRVMDAFKRHCAKQVSHWEKRRAELTANRFSVAMTLMQHQGLHRRVSEISNDIRCLQQMIGEWGNFGLSSVRHDPVAAQFDRIRMSLSQITSIFNRGVESTKDKSIDELGNVGDAVRIGVLIRGVLNSVRCGLQSKGLSVKVVGASEELIEPQRGQVVLVIEQVLHDVIDDASDGESIDIEIVEHEWNIELVITGQGRVFSDDERQQVGNVDPLKGVGSRAWNLGLTTSSAWSVGVDLSVETTACGSANVFRLLIPKVTS